MRRSWLGLQLLLGCVLLLAVLVAKGKCCKEEEESSSEEEYHCVKRCHCVEECCEKRHHHEEEECCCEKRHHHEEEECCCEKRHHHKEEECCCEKRHHHEEEECCCEKRHHHKEEECCCEKRHHHEEEECCCEKRHHHEEDKCCKKRHSHGEEEEADKKKHPHVAKKHPKKRHPRLEESEEASSDSSEHYKHMAEEEQRDIAELAAQSMNVMRHHRKEQAIAYYNQGIDGAYYKHLDDAQVEVQKAIGVMVYVKMLLGKTNCTNNKEEEAGVEHSRAYLEKQGCQLLPQLNQELLRESLQLHGCEVKSGFPVDFACQRVAKGDKHLKFDHLDPGDAAKKHNCTFGIFVDMRTEKKAVVSQDCIRIPGIKEFPKLFKGPPF